LIKGTHNVEKICAMHLEHLEAGEWQKVPILQNDILHFISTILESDSDI
jgi:hypothetical protein